MWPNAKTAYLILLARAAMLAGASPVEIEERQSSCPGVHVFGARETTVGPGYGSSATVVNLVLQAYPGSTAEAIVYPACGGQASCGGIAYGDSARQGTAAVASAVNSFNQRCPDTQLVLVGYSQVSLEGWSIYEVAVTDIRTRVAKSWITPSAEVATQDPASRAPPCP